MKKTEKKQIERVIWSSDAYFNEECRAAYEQDLREFMDDPADYEPTDEDWYNEVNSWIDDERINLNKQVNGVIVALASVGTWRGRRQGYKICGDNVADILYSNCDYATWYGDSYNIRGRMSHHDGNNYVLYRVAENRDVAEKIADKIYDGEMSEEQFCKATRSLYPYVADVYGWPVRKNMRLNKTA